MSITDLWGRHRQARPVIDEQEPRPWKLPPDLEQQLADVMDDYGDTQQLEPEPEPIRTAKEVADEIANYQTRLAEAEECLAKGKTHLAGLKAELATKIEQEAAAHQAECAVKLAALDKLRSTGDTHATTDDDPSGAGHAGADNGAGSGATMPEPAADQG